jgi:hypothetical protein
MYFPLFFILQYTENQIFIKKPCAAIPSAGFCIPTPKSGEDLLFGGRTISIHSLGFGHLYPGGGFFRPVQQIVHFRVPRPLADHFVPYRLVVFAVWVILDLLRGGYGGRVLHLFFRSLFFHTFLFLQWSKDSFSGARCTWPD